MTVNVLRLKKKKETVCIASVLEHLVYNVAYVVLSPRVTLPTSALQNSSFLASVYCSVLCAFRV